jgi:release factor glutamine methyltransferase
VPTVADLLQRSRLPTLEARALLAHVLTTTRETLIAHPERGVDAPTAVRFHALVARRRSGAPIAYLVGEREFYGRSFSVTPDVLVPRPETELLVELVLARAALTHAPGMLDLGTGSGCIAISLALGRPDARVVAVDISEAALRVARGNAERLGARVVFKHSDWYSEVSERFDFVVANPPYVAQGDPHLLDLQHEPQDALVAADDGLACLRAIVAGAPQRLNERGWLLVEHGYNQAAAVRDLFLEVGFKSIATHVDAANIERVSLGTLEHVQASEAKPRVEPSGATRPLSPGERG